MGKFINPFTDFGFHRIFGQEVHKELLIDFLNQLFFGEHYIEDITFLNPIQTPETLDDRGIVFDVHCKDSNGNLFVVEMQTGAQPYFHDRGLYYLARAISNQGQKGKDWKFVLQPVYGVFLLNYKMDVNSKFRTDVYWRTGRPEGCLATGYGKSISSCLTSKKNRTSARMILNVGFIY